MRVLHVAALYPPETGGMARVPFEIARRQAARGMEVHVFTPAYRGNQGIATEEGVTVHRARPILRSANGKAGLSFALLWLLRREQFDVVHLHVPCFGIQEWLAVWLLVDRRARFVLTYHMDVVSAGTVAFLAQAFRRLALPLLLFRADMVMVASRDYARHSWIGPWMQRHADRVAEAPFGVDLERFKPIPHQHQTMRLLFVAGLGPNHYFKGLTILLDALACLRTQGDVELLVVGDGSLRLMYEKHARRLGLMNRVQFLGAISDDDLAEVYAHADLFVLPSTDRSEAFGLVLLEAQASGLPVVASNLDGVRTLMEPGVTGMLVRPRDVAELSSVIATFLADADRRVCMGKAARARMEERYSWDRHLDLLSDVYKMST